jgi:DNA mismatch repair protein MutS2
VKRGSPIDDFRIDEKSLTALEYFEIIDLLEKNACSPVGQEQCRQVRPHADLTRIQKSLSEIKELKRIDQEWGPLPLVDIRDTRDALSQVRVEGTILEPGVLNGILANIEVCQAVKRFYGAIPVDLPHVGALMDRLLLCGEVGEQIRQCLDPDGAIRDEASPRLSRLRGSIRHMRAKIQQRMESLVNQEDLQPFLRDRIITQRNGRTVLLVKPESRGRIKGIVHDYSHRRMSLFVEPISVVEMNNDLNVLLDEEREEEIQVLTRLTASVRQRVDDLQADLECLGQLDLACAKMKLSRLIQGIQPEIRQTGGLRFLKARHPLLFHRKPDETVPVDLILEKDHPVLIISGANAGGKTVALKTLGLLVVMFQSGMEIPLGEGSEISLFRRVYAKIGDEQSIGEDLSTFSAHLARLEEILEGADAHSLILVDEIGGGTNVTEGAALAMGVLDRLREAGGTVAVTTHLESVKGYGYVTPGVINGGVEFDPETLQPRYRLVYGTSAPSHAFLVAEKMAFPRDVLDRARQYQRETEGETAAMIQRLEELQEAVNRERVRLEKLQEEAAQHRDQLSTSVQKIREKRDHILLGIEERGRKLLRQTEKELRKVLEGLRPPEPGEKRPERKLREVEEQFRSRLTRSKRKRSKVKDLRPGEWVRIVDLNREGTVSHVQDAMNTAEVMVGQFKIKTSLDNLERAGVTRPGSDTSSPVRVMFSPDEVRREINVVGLTVDEALPLVDRLIDRALLGNLETVTIIHGSGSGRLRDGIRSYLKGHKAVTRFEPGDPLRGGLGVTVVHLGKDRKVAVNDQPDERPL